MRIIEWNATSPIVDGDYRHALVHLAWYREEKKRFLLFGMVELFPSELPEPDWTEELSYRVKSLGRQHCVYVRRIVMTVQEALEWYDRCREGHVMLPNTNGQWDRLEASRLREEPPWPNLLTTRQLPFHSWGAVRAHHLIQTDVLPETQRPLTDGEAVSWLADRLFFNFLEYDEWLGSVNLVAPNPVLRNLYHTLAIEQTGEASDIRLIVRQGYDVHGLVLYLGEHRHGGVVSYRQIELDGTYFRIFHVGRTEQVSLVLFCPQRGVLEWHDPTGFLRQIGVTIGIHSATKVVKVPDTPRRSGETFRQEIMTSAGDTILGDTNDDGGVSAHLYSAKRHHEQKKEAERFGQKLFHENEDEARIFIRSLISRARKRVWIVDPYAATCELFAYALAARPEVHVRIITSAEHLRNKCQIMSARESGEVLLEQRNALLDKERFEILVMTGSSAPIHDRFLVIDDNVWLSGNSLGSIGKRAGMIIRLPAPEEVIDFITRLIDCSASSVMGLEKWVETRKLSKGELALNDRDSD